MYTKKGDRSECRQEYLRCYIVVACQNLLQLSQIIFYEQKLLCRRNTNYTFYFLLEHTIAYVSFFLFCTLPSTTLPRIRIKSTRNSPIETNHTEIASHIFSFVSLPQSIGNFSRQF